MVGCSFILGIFGVLCPQLTWLFSPGYLFSYDASAGRSGLVLAANRAFLIASSRAEGKGRGLRIVLVEPWLGDDGALRVSLDRASRWRDEGALVTVFVVFRVVENGDALPVPEGLPLRFATRLPRRFRWTMIIGTFRLWRLARRADVVVAGREVGPGLLLGALVARLARRPYAVTVQSHPDHALREFVEGDRFRALTRRALVNADLAVCVSSGLAPTVVALGVPQDRVGIVRNGVDVVGIQQAAARPAPFELPPGLIVVGSGRLHRQKGFDILLRAHARALALGAPPHTLIILGDGPDRAALQSLAVSLEVSGSVVLAGFVSNPHSVVARADVFVLASRWEGFGLAAAEALVCGTPTIATDCIAGPAEVLDGGQFGHLVPVENADALADALVEHLRDPQPLRARAARAKQSAGERFDASGAARAHLTLLVGLASAK